MILPATVTKVIHHVACQAAYRFLQFGHSRQDLEQEMILHYLRHEHQYVAGLASVPTFAARICRHRLSNLYATETACKRRASGGMTSLSEPIATGLSGETFELEGTLSADVCSMKLGRQSRPAPELHDLHIDVERVLAGLRPGLALFARLLTDESVIDAARAAGFSRATAHRRIQDLRTVFTLHGLDRYVFGVRKGPQAHQRAR
jgi:DNA-directed RNA polymerase specialized sigma24 family protein